MELKSTYVLGYKIFADDLNKVQISNKKTIINTINAHSYTVAKKDKAFQLSLKRSDILLPDGSGIVLASTYHNKDHIKKIAGADLHVHLLELLNQTSGKCFYLGSSSTTLNKIKIRINKEYPNIKIETYAPPFKKYFSSEDNLKMLESINKFNPDVLFIGMTAPKQEKWLYMHKDQIDAKIMSSIGAVFDFYAGNVIRPSQFWIDLHLEWLPRFLKEPRRLWKRNFVSSPLFLFDILRYKRFSLKNSLLL